MRRTPFSPLSARALVPGVALGAALALSGCQTQSTIQTDVPYQPADGVAVDLGTVQIRNLVVISDAENGPGVLSGSVVNTGSTDERITIAAEGSAPVTVESPAHEVETISGESQVALPTVAAAPGEVVTLSVQSTTSGANIVRVPVLPPVGYYETLKPSVAATRS